MTPEEMKAALVQMNDDAWHNRDVEAAYDIYSGDVVFHSPPFPPVAGREANKQTDAGILAAFTETHSTIHDMVVEGDLVAVRWTEAEMVARMAHFAVAFFGYHLQGREDLAWYCSEDFVAQHDDLAWGVYGGE
jgi:hypothetical protein